MHNQFGSRCVKWLKQLRYWPYSSSVLRSNRISTNEESHVRLKRHIYLLRVLKMT